ncbi:peptidase domain-containing ABC transporter [Synechococcus sp. CBW1002]|uniref:ABC transporter transmembrane domain-containing protein n=1 Tax=Synechococcus sp. CBW1002 TaxID=1353134 RepID=UPI0018CDE7A8|nr:peptidase domain-containing ABC transporter [Synechococcus sp. CBW1002]QPN60183.1 peptidase domain-containing ABC transporter [Synechococcus sp. CBW1002]
MSETISMQELLARLILFAGLPEPMLQQLASAARVLRFQLGQPLSRPDCVSDHIYVVLEGQVRSVVQSPRLPKRVATLERLGVGSVLCLSGLTSGRPGGWETLIASTETVVLALPHALLRQVMQAHAPLGDRINRVLSPAELFAVLDAYLRDYPRALEQEVVAAALQLAPTCYVRYLDPQDPVVQQLPQDRLWLVTGGALPLATVLPIADPPPAADPAAVEAPVPGPASADSSSGDSSSGDSASGDSASAGSTATEAAAAAARPRVVRAVGIDQAALEAILEPKPEANADSGSATSAQDGAALSLSRWQEHLRIQDASTIPEADFLEEFEAEEPLDVERQPPEAFPWYRGVGPLESPIAAFRMLSDFLGLPFRKELMQRVFSDQVKRHGEASLALTGAVAESIGLQTQLLEIKADSLARLTCPLMVRWGNGLAVIYRIRAKQIVLGIPASGNVEISLDDFKEQWGSEGEVITLAVNEFTPKRKFGFRWFLPALRQHRAVLIEVLLASFFVQLFGLVNPLLIQQIIDKVIINNSSSALGLLGSLLVVFAIFEGLLLCLRTFLFIDTTNRIDLALGTRIIDHLLRLPLKYFDRRPVGEISNRIGELEKVRGFLTGTALTTILDAIFALLYVVVMLIYSWQLTLLTLSVIPVLVVLTLAVSPMVRSQLQSRAVANARTQSHLVEVLGSMMTVKAQNIELRSRWKWQDLYTDFVAEGFDNTLLSTTAGTFSAFLNKLSSLLVIWGGAALVLKGDLTLGELIAFRIISGYVTQPLLRMTSVWQSVQETALSLERLSDIIDTPQEAPEDNASRIVMPSIEGRVDFQNVEFRYQNSAPLMLNGVNLSIPKGAFVAIVGTSGSGKSTLTKLLARLYSPEKGSVLIDGVDINKVELYSLRRQLGIVPQDTVLFDGTLEENITLTNPEASSEEIIQAATVAAAHDFIMALPAGYSNQVGERGSSLSGGQRQRIAIARTILQKPKMLIMDEATSALDYQTERVVCENLMQSLRHCTVLFITHRLTSIVNADMIVCMGNGSILEVGKHEQLMANRGPYYALFMQQGARGSSSSSSSSSYRPVDPAQGTYALGASRA